MGISPNVLALAAAGGRSDQYGRLEMIEVTRPITLLSDDLDRLSRKHHVWRRRFVKGEPRGCDAL